MIFQEFLSLGEDTIDLSEMVVDLVIILIISIGISIWIFFDARRRGINPKPWIILTLLFWVLGLVGYLTLRRQVIRRQAANPGFMDLSPNRSSPPENYEIQMNESLQGALLLQKNLQGIRNNKEQKNKKICEQCGASIHRHATHCPICGRFTVLNS